jgi:ribonuclease P protein component
VQSFAPAGPRGALVSAFDVIAAADVDFGFRVEHRLCKTDEFSSVFALRRSVRGSSFELHSRETPGTSARLGVVVAKKLVHLAVHRNLVKRIVRESFRLVRAGLPSRDIVVRVTARIDTPDRQVLRDEIDSLFARLKQ